MKILMPFSFEFNFNPPADVDVARYHVTKAIPAEHRDADAIVLSRNPAERLKQLPIELPHLKWVQGLMAGPDAVLAAGFGPDVRICAGIDLHNETVSEHALALMLAAARRLDLTVRAQIDRRWGRGTTGTSNLDDGGFTMLTGSNVILWGFGRIAAHLAPLLTALGANVTGVARTAGNRDGYPVITADDLPAHLPTTDVLVSIMPGGKASAEIIDAEIFDALPAHAWFINVGRGSVVNEPDLVRALEAGAIGGAALDVVTTEPLPESHPLWSTPNTIITPHIAGGRPKQPGRLIAENIRRYLAGEELLGVTTA